MDYVNAAAQALLQFALKTVLRHRNRFAEKTDIDIGMFAEAPRLQNRAEDQNALIWNKLSKSGLQLLQNKPSGVLTLPAAAILDFSQQCHCG